MIPINIEEIDDIEPVKQTIDEMILNLAGQGIVKSDIKHIIKKEISLSGTTSLWTEEEIEREINLMY